VRRLNPFIALLDTWRTCYSENRLTDGHCREASIAHFQGWKRDYYAFTARVPPDNAHAMVVTEAGVVPLVLRTAGAVPYSQLNGDTVVSAGRLQPADLVPPGDLSARGLRSALMLMLVPRLQGAARSQRSSAARTAEPVATAYCMRRSEDLKRCERHVFAEDISVIPGGGYNRYDPATDVTMIKVGWLQEYRKTLYEEEFDGPQVLRTVLNVLYQ
jgi:hypothetical protein